MYEGCTYLKCFEFNELPTSSCCVTTCLPNKRTMSLPSNEDLGGLANHQIASLDVALAPAEGGDRQGAA